MVVADRVIERLAEMQHGLVTRTQAVESGLSERQVRRRVAEGRWTVVDRRLYRLGGAPQTWQQTVMAHCLGLDGLASHWTAAHLWGLAGSPSRTIHVAVSPEDYRLREGVFVHQYSQIGLFTPEHIDGIPVTPAAVTALDLCGRLRLDEATGAVAVAVEDAGLPKPVMEWEVVLPNGRRHPPVRRLFQGRRGRIGGAIPWIWWVRCRR